MASEIVRPRTQSISGTRKKRSAKRTINSSSVTDKERWTVSMTTIGSRPKNKSASPTGRSVIMKRVSGSKTRKQKSGPAKTSRMKRRRNGVKSLRRISKRSVRRTQTLSGTWVKKNAKRTGKLRTATGKPQSIVSISTSGTRPQSLSASLSRRSVKRKRVRGIKKRKPAKTLRR